MTDHPLGHPDSPYLTLAEAASFCRFDTCAKPAIAFRKWAVRNRVPMLRRGRVLLFERRVLVQFLEGQSWTKRMPRSFARRSA